MTPETRTFDSAVLARALDGRYGDFATRSAPYNEVRACAAWLVDAFGIPDEVLAAPIGRSDAYAAAG